MTPDQLRKKIEALRAHGWTAKAESFSDQRDGAGWKLVIDEAKSFDAGGDGRTL